MNEIKVLNKGFVRLMEYCASDEGICDAARVSYKKGKKVRGNRELIRYLLRHEHGTPFEMNFFKFNIKAPIFVFRQWHRHRVGVSINEISARYSKLNDECFIPELSRIQGQDALNHQASDGEQIEESSWVQGNMKEEQKNIFDNYQSYIKSGTAREIARINLPVSTYSQMYWACNLRSLFHFLGLRMHPHAQKEIQEYAKAMYELIKPIVPMSCEAFEDYVIGAVRFSKQEMELIRNFPLTEQDLKGLSKHERVEFLKKVGWEI